MIYVTRREVFSASHRLFNPELSDEENEIIFDKCNNYNGHGHNYVLEVVVAGEVNPRTGYVIDLKKLKKIIIENVIKKVDHKNLNLDVDFLKGKIPTAENIAIGIWEQLEDKIEEGELYSVKLYETENNYVEYKGK
ncbi:6-carboxytetrahydropterin synthase [Stygiobacter electus]|uniref:6-carboxy-5,6,7,8-tetrahydropterin synthase n=1 Tax=Stygiobacter electus TaxID=3032292 RepID=A0AAE3NYQ5_9BACT|nr:6-carboxytetrahydropterin synthase [Stygiobacter electus]MDF1611075.1 6-carboxytetrahydropterin synthase [Stygiobacter electus]